MKISGDFRTRYQYELRNSFDGNEKDRSRGRIRLRLGVDTKINDKVNVGSVLPPMAAMPGPITFPSATAILLLPRMAWF